MLRLALVAGLIATAYGATSGTMVTIYMFDGGAAAADQAKCQDDGLNAGDEGDEVAAGTTNTLGTSGLTNGFITTGGPKFDAVAALVAWAPFIVDQCYNLGGSGSVAEALPILGSMAGGHANSIIFTDGTEVLKSIKFKGGDGTLALTMEAYTAQDCATAVSYQSGVLQPVTGSCDQSGSCTTCVTEDTCDITSEGVWTYGWQCAEADPSDATLVNAISSGYENAEGGGGADMTKNAGFATTYITVNAYTWSSTLACSTALANQDAANAGMGVAYWPICTNEFNCDQATHRNANVATAGAAGELYMWQNAMCFTDNATASWQVRCDPTNGSITHTVFTGDECDIADKTNNGASSGSTFWTKNSHCTAVADSTSASWQVENTDVEWETLCPTIGVSGGTTGVKHVKVYATTTTLARASGTTLADMTGAGVLGSRDVLMGVCYTADSSGQMTGFIGGPFGEGASTTMPVSSKNSFMFAQDTASGKTTEIELLHYDEHDCSGTGTSLDDGADAATGWPYAGFAIFDGTASTAAVAMGTASAAGTTANQLSSATKFITVKRHTDATTANAVHGAEGVCLGKGTEVLGRVLDHFVLDSCNVHTTGDATTSKSYKWTCDTTTGNIGYAEYVGEACAGTATTGTALTFTKAAAVSAVGGKCLQVGAAGSNVSWEIRNDDTQWDAMCSIASSDSDDASDSSAGKVAATVAAGAAAAAALLI